MKVNDVNLIGFLYRVIWLIQAEAQFPSWLHLWGTVPIMVTYLRHSYHHGYIWGTVPIMVTCLRCSSHHGYILRHSSHHGYLSEAQFPSWLHLGGTFPIMATYLRHRSHHGYISEAQNPSWLHLCSTVLVIVTYLRHSSHHDCKSGSQFHCGYISICERITQLKYLYHGLKTKFMEWRWNMFFNVNLSNYQDHLYLNV